MKTITEYAPMVIGEVLARARRREERRGWRRWFWRHEIHWLNRFRRRRP